MAEQEIMRDEAGRIAAGADPRDTSSYSSWRETTDGSILEALDLYGSYLIGQANGMSDALSLQAIEVALRFAGIPRADRADLALRCIQIHSGVMEIARLRERKAGRRG